MILLFFFLSYLERRVNMNRAQLFLKKHSSTILTVVGAVGVITTTVLAVKATPKALKLIEEAEDEKGEELTVVETVKTAWKPYVPTAISCTSTLVCIFGAHYLSARTQASLMSAYAVLDSTFKEYREKIREKCPEESIRYEHEMILSKYDGSLDVDEDDGKELFWDYQSLRYFRASLEEVKNAEYLLNQKLATTGFACLNDFYDFLNMEHIPYGYQLGWSTMYSDKAYGDDELLNFTYEPAQYDGLKCKIMTINYSESLEYTC